ncbi:hypothetical protein FRC06_004378 [Ceratobasidium sp. 370]|nr:hypothetical protein FRC06_004378 [Ceratobasidium sp. 370]
MQHHNDCEKVLDFMETLGINLGTFIHSILYGNPKSRAPDKMRLARNSFVQTDQFLRNVYGPPKPPNGKGVVPATAKNTLLSFAVSLTRDIFTAELKSLIEVDTMEAISSDALAKDMKKHCPTLWDTLAGLAGNETVVLDEERVAEEKEAEAKRKEEEESANEAQIGGAEEGEDEDSDGLCTPIKPHPHFVSIF